VDITTIVLAAAHTVGLDVRHDRGGLALLLPAGTERLSDQTRKAILTLIRAAVTDTVNSALNSRVVIEQATGYWPSTPRWT